MSTSVLESVLADLAAESDRLESLVSGLDEAGYLPGSLDDVAMRLGAPVDLVEGVLATLQGFDPPGVFARTLAECLALQLKDANRYDPQIARLLDNLALLGSHNLSALRRAVGVDADELVEMVAEIRKLNPKPGLKFGSIQIQPILPDVLVRPAADGSWVVELNSETLPRPSRMTTSIACSYSSSRLRSESESVLPLAVVALSCASSVLYCGSRSLKKSMTLFISSSPTYVPCARVR